MHGTITGHDLYEEVSRCVNEMELPWGKTRGFDNRRSTCDVWTQERTRGEDTGEDALGKRHS